jgi:hypothetical protein
VPLLTEVPDELKFRGIEPPQDAHAFTITLDVADPRGGGRVEGRVERLRAGRDPRPVAVEVRCAAAWLDIPPQLVGKKRLLSWSSYWDIRSRAVPVWLDEELFLDRVEVGPLDDANWRQFSFLLPDGLPRALEGTFVAFRWRLEGRRRRLVGNDLASIPLLFQEPRTIPVVRIETTPIGTWRLLEWKSELETDGAGGPCSVSYEERRSEDMPLPGETREKELARRTGT